MKSLTTAMLPEIREKIKRKQYEFSKHAVDQSIIRSISVVELEVAIGGKAEINEDYPQDKYGPSCLILVFTKAGRPLHVQCSYLSRPLIKIVTLYQPDPALWIDYGAPLLIKIPVYDYALKVRINMAR